MCCRADRRRAPARGQCRRPTADVRLPRLLSAVHRHPGRAALPGRAGPLSGLPGLRAGPPRWEALQIPVGLAFFFRNSALDRTVAFYPGPGGRHRVRTGPRRLERRSRDADAAGEHARRRRRGPAGPGARRRRPQPPQCYLVPIDACYEFVGRLRMLWRGFDGGQEVREFIDEFFDRVDARSKAARER